MKNYILVFSILISYGLYSQNGFSDLSLKQYQVGIFLTGKGCVNTVEPPQGIKNDFQVSKLPDFGLKFSYKFISTNTKLFTDISYLSTYMKYKLYYNSSINWTNEFHYINLGVGFEFSNFLLSFNIGLPTSGKLNVTHDNSIELKKNDMNTMFQLRVGGSIPIVQDLLGDLNFIVFADYFLVGALKQDSNYNPRIASLSFGLNYMFNL